MWSNRIFFLLTLLCCASNVFGMKRLGDNPDGDRPAKRARVEEGNLPKIEKGALHKAIEEGNLKEVLRLCKQGADITEKHPIWGTPLDNAITQGYSSIVQILVEYGANVNEPGTMHLAATQSRKIFANLHQRCGGDIEAKTFDGQTLLHFALSEGKKDIAMYLLGQGVNYKAKDVHGETPRKYIDPNLPDMNKIRLILKNPALVRNVIIEELPYIKNITPVIFDREIGKSGKKRLTL